MSSCTRASAGISCPGHCRLTSGCPPSGRWPRIWRSASSPCRMPMSQLAGGGLHLLARRSGATTSSPVRAAPYRRRPGSLPRLPPEPEHVKTYFLDLVDQFHRHGRISPSTVWAQPHAGDAARSGTRPCCRPPPTNGACRSCAGPSAELSAPASVASERGQRPDHRRRRYGDSVFALLIQLLGRERWLRPWRTPDTAKHCRKFTSSGIRWICGGWDWMRKGLSTRLLRRQEADIVHLSPSHHYPTGHRHAHRHGGRSCCTGRRSRRDAGYWRMTTTASSASWAVPSPRCSPSTRPSG